MNTPLISDIDGMTPHIGRLFSMMSYARSTTISAVEGMSRANLDHLQDSGSNSIGALLFHIAAVEKIFQCQTLWDRGLNEQEKPEWQAALDLGDIGRDQIRGHDLDFYVGKLDSVRSTTRTELEKRDDDWLHTPTTRRDGRPSNHYFTWFHMFEDELNHRGQIRWLAKRLPSKVT